MINTKPKENQMKLLNRAINRLEQAQESFFEKDRLTKDILNKESFHKASNESVNSSDDTLAKNQAVEQISLRLTDMINRIKLILDK